MNNYYLIRYLIFILIISLNLPITYSQIPALDWVKTIESGNGFVANASSDFDQAGNLYNVGYYSGTVDMDPDTGVFNLESDSSEDIIVSKYDPDGNLLWAKSMGGPTWDYGQDGEIDQSGNIYLTGLFQGTVDFDPGPGTFNLTSAGFADVFILKLGPNGDLIWAKRFGNTSSDYGLGLALDPLGNVYITGEFSGTVDFDPGVGVFNLTSAPTANDLFISKLSYTGSFVWAKKIGANQIEVGRGIDVDVTGHVYTTGYFSGTVDFDPGPGVFNLSCAPGFADVFVLKFDDQGNFIWVRQLGGSGYQHGYSITTDNSGNVLTSGSIQHPADFDPGPGTFNLAPQGSLDVFISKLDSAGNFLWACLVGGPQLDYGRPLTTDVDENVYLTGLYLGLVDLNPGPGFYNLTSKGDYDYYIIQLSAGGNFKWARSFGSDSTDYSNTIAVNNQGNIYLTGGFQDTVDFDPGPDSFKLTSTGPAGFIQKLGQCFPSSSNISPIACTQYISPSGKYVWTNDGIYHDTIPNSTGCDSAITINLTVKTVNTGVTNNSPILTAQATSATYQWMNCNPPLPLAGEINQSFLASINGFYAVIVTENGCTDTSTCYLVNNVGIKELENENQITSQLLLYPSPATHKIHIKSQTHLNGIWRIIDLHGRTLNSGDLNGEKLKTLDITQLSMGLFVLEISTPSAILQFKFIKS